MHVCVRWIPRESEALSKGALEGGHDRGPRCQRLSGRALSEPRGQPGGERGPPLWEPRAGSAASIVPRPRVLDAFSGALSCLLRSCHRCRESRDNRSGSRSGSTSTSGPLQSCSCTCSVTRQTQRQNARRSLASWFSPACVSERTRDRITFSIHESHLTGLQFGIPASKGPRPSQPPGTPWKLQREGLGSGGQVQA